MCIGYHDRCLSVGVGMGGPTNELYMFEVRLYFQTRARQRANMHFVRMHAPPSLTRNLNQVPPSRHYRERASGSRLRNSIFGLFCLLIPRQRTQSGSLLVGRPLSLSTLICLNTGLSKSLHHARRQQIGACNYFCQCLLCRLCATVVCA
jgi:hypothetical protein